MRKSLITPFVCGYNLAAEDTLFRGGSPKRLRPIVCLAWLIELETKRILVDTGINSLKVCNQTLRGENKWEQDQSLADQLALKGHKPDDIDQVILTHLHYDHSSNLPLFEKAEVILSQKELDGFKSLSSAQQEAQAEVISFLNHHSKVKLITDVFEDEIIKIKVIGGHTPGSLWVELVSQIGPLLLVGDNLFLQANLEEDCPIGFAAEKVTCTWVVDYLKSYPKTVLPSHDPDVLALFK